MHYLEDIAVLWYADRFGMSFNVGIGIIEHIIGYV